MKNIIACIDGSAMATPVSNAAIWAAQRLDKTLLFMHCLEKAHQHGADDLTGNIGLGARSALLQEMAALDEKRSKVAMQLGKELLTVAEAQAKALGVKDSRRLQRHGDLVDALVELESDARFMIVGRTGEGHKGDFKALGSHIEYLIRQVQTPVMITTREFNEPRNFMLAYDGRGIADKAVQRIIQGGLLRGLTCHLVTVKNSDKAQREKVAHTQQRLENEGFKVQATFLEGDVFKSLKDYKARHQIDLLVMGAFAHSKMRRFLLGSTTMRMIEECQTPLIVLR